MTCCCRLMNMAFIVSIFAPCSAMRSFGSAFLPVSSSQNLQNHLKPVLLDLTKKSYSFFCKSVQPRCTQDVQRSQLIALHSCPTSFLHCLHNGVISSTWSRCKFFEGDFFCFVWEDCFLPPALPFLVCDWVNQILSSQSTWFWLLLVMTWPERVAGMITEFLVS